MNFRPTNWLTFILLIDLTMAPAVLLAYTVQKIMPSLVGARVEAKKRQSACNLEACLLPAKNF